MNLVTGLMLLAAALLADVAVEITAELASEPLLDGDAGTVVAITAASPSDIVDTMPGATIRWKR